jgi:tripartite ATP-independent transporter DctP family solute receptor
MPTDFENVRLPGYICLAGASDQDDPPSKGANAVSRTLTRRAVIGGGATLGSLTIVSGTGIAADFKFRQFHNQAVSSPLHKRLVEMWAAVKAETNGRVDTDVFAENAGIQGSDPAALKMLISGELDFFTLMGGILGQAVPVAEAQQVPFAFKTAGEAHAAADGALGGYLREEMAAKGLYGLPVMAFDNGMRQTSTTNRPIVVPGDFDGIRIRLPAGQMFTDTFKALGAEPVTINVNQIYDGLKHGKVDAQENPLAVTEVFKLYEVQKHMAMTNHMWSGFNLMANLALWRKLPADIQIVIERNAAKYVRLQREDQGAFNGSLRKTLTERGMVFNDVDQDPFRARMAPVYADWKEKLGSKCWSLLEGHVGKLG